MIDQQNAICNSLLKDYLQMYTNSKCFSYFISDEPNALAFQNLRRMCMGKSDCPTTKFCGQRGVSLHVVYHCIEGKVSQSTLCSLSMLESV